jgi:hypothetical protein
MSESKCRHMPDVGDDESESQLEVLTSTLDPKPEGWKKWMDVVLRYGGNIYMPSQMIGMSPSEAIVIAGLDGVSVIPFEGNVYLPSEWYAKVRPEKAEDIKTMVAACLKRK